MRPTRHRPRPRIRGPTRRSAQGLPLLLPACSWARCCFQAGLSTQGPLWPPGPRATALLASDARQRDHLPPSVETHPGPRRRGAVAAGRPSSLGLLICNTGGLRNRAGVPKGPGQYGGPGKRGSLPGPPVTLQCAPPQTITEPHPAVLPPVGGRVRNCDERTMRWHGQGWHPGPGTPAAPVNSLEWAERWPQRDRSGSSPPAPQVPPSGETGSLWLRTVQTRSPGSRWALVRYDWRPYEQNSMGGRRHGEQARCPRRQLWGAGEHRGWGGFSLGLQRSTARPHVPSDWGLQNCFLKHPLVICYGSARTRAPTLLSAAGTLPGGPGRAGGTLSAGGAAVICSSGSARGLARASALASLGSLGGGRWASALPPVGSLGGGSGHWRWPWCSEEPLEEGGGRAPGWRSLCCLDE